MNNIIKQPLKQKWTGPFDKSEKYVHDNDSFSSSIRSNFQRDMFRRPIFK